MNRVHISAVVGKDRRLVLDLPEDTPTGPVEIIIQQVTTEPDVSVNPQREAARRRLQAAGLLSNAHHIPDGTAIPTDAEVIAAGQLPPDARPSEDWISQDRDE
ncbi:MAG: hypothetical protein JNM70_17865 [Anaerolineae bacterium]|nr:hypothetical protein [Anaerolineae bacterium]